MGWSCTCTAGPVATLQFSPEHTETSRRSNRCIVARAALVTRPRTVSVESSMRASSLVLLALAWTSTLACKPEREKPIAGLASDVGHTKHLVDNEEPRVKAPRDEAEDILKALLPFAKQMLEQHGEFYPFAGAMLRDGSITAVSYQDGHDHPSSQQVIDGIVAGFRAAAKVGTYRAVGVAYDIATVLPGGAEKTDAIAVRLDHESGYSVQVVFPYRIVRPGEVVVAEPFATPGTSDVFSPK